MYKLCKLASQHLHLHLFCSFKKCKANVGKSTIDYRIETVSKRSSTIGQGVRDSRWFVTACCDRATLRRYIRGRSLFFVRKYLRPTRNWILLSICLVQVDCSHCKSSLHYSSSFIYTCTTTLPFFFFKNPSPSLLSLSLIFPMHHLTAFTLVSLTISVAALVLPRTAPPADWSPALEVPTLPFFLKYDPLNLIYQQYDTYHSRYIALDCPSKHNSSFFDQCCHPLLVCFLLPCKLIIFIEFYI